MPAVSIVTPAYNAARFLAEAIESAQRQTFDDFEMLIVDDGSKDDTADITEEFGARDPRIRLIRQRNAGTAAARNTAIRAARGELFALLDSDDVWLPEFLEVQLGILQQHPDVDILSSNALNLGSDAHGQPIKPASNDLTPVSLLDLIQRDDAVFIMSVFRRRVIERIGDFDPLVLMNEDYEFWVRAARAGCRILFNQRPLVWYRRRNDSKSTNQDAMFAGIVAVLRQLRERCADSPTELAAIDRQIARFNVKRMAVHTKAALFRFALQA
jgi:glycosyltransferase involved in cell wall biosynthesis